MPPFLRQFFAVRQIDPADKSGAKRLNQALGAWSLTAIGLGATIGTGIFVLTGTVAAQQAGPAVTPVVIDSSLRQRARGAVLCGVRHLPADSGQRL